jgi:integrase
MARITKKAVDALAPDPAGDYWVWDGDLPGFGVRVWPSGRKVYMVQYRAAGRTRKIKLGVHGATTPAAARQEAMEILTAAGKGGDPAEARDRARHAPTVAELAARYLEEHAGPKKKPRSAAMDRRNIERYINPALGRLRADALTRQDVASLHHSLREKPYQANRVLALLSKMMNLAEHWGIRPDGSNPCRHVEKFKEKKRERYLSSEELARLGHVLAEAEQDGSESPSAIYAVRLLLLTGARLSEILTLRWEHVDYETACLRLPDSKTGAKDIPLNSPALEALATMPRYHDNPHVIPGAKPGAHLVNLSKPWRRIRARAGLSNVRLHDLRHSYASVAAASGLGLPIIGALLGHTQAQTTKRYTHLAMDPLRAATEEVGKRIAAALTAPAKVKVLPLRRQ